MKKAATNLDEILKTCRAFAQARKTLQLATVDAQGIPEASYAPYVQHEGRYYVYLSQLAKHNANLNQRPMCSVLLIEDEDDAGHLFARQRLTLQCTVRVWERDSVRFEQVLDLFAQRFGEFMKVIRPLQDFQLFELQPQSGSYVAGFAKAYSLTGDDLSHIRHRNDQGHQSPQPDTPLRLAEEVAE